MTLLLFLLTSLTPNAQESPAPQLSPSPANVKSVRVSFVPPPLEGGISLGIYDATGKLVRVLHREAELEDFEVGPDALSATWDGKSDAGETLAPGKYHARGYVVGDVNVDGVGYFFNDWVTGEDSPHIARIENFARNTEQSLILLSTLAGGENTNIAFDLQREQKASWAAKGFDFYDLVSAERRNLRVESGKLSLDVLTAENYVQWPELISPQDASFGRGDTVWVVDGAADGAGAREVKQFSRKGEFLRRLSFGPDEPAPKLIRASTADDTLFLLEENSGMQRMRELILLDAKSENGRLVSDWKVGFEKKIVAHKDFTIDGGKPVATGGRAALEKITIRLQSNPLEKDGKNSVELAVGHDDDGSYLQTADGLPLLDVSETPHLTRIVLSAHGEKSIDVFQDDESVVEQFRITGLDRMMAFDCGEFDLK